MKTFSLQNSRLTKGPSPKTLLKNLFLTKEINEALEKRNVQKSLLSVLGQMLQNRFSCTLRRSAIS